MKTKNKLITLSLLSFLSINSYALTMDEAINISFNNNFDVEAQKYAYEESLENVSLNNANNLPKIDLAYTYNSRDEVNTGYAKEDGTASAVLSYNLFDGFKTKSNKKAASLLASSSKYTLMALQADVALNTKKAYINYLNAKNSLETYDSAYLLFQEQFRDSQNRFKQGLLSKNDLLQVQVNMSTSKQNVVKAKGALKIAKYKLSNILGGYDLEKENIVDLQEDTFNMISTDESALENRSEIKALKQNTASIHQNKKVSVDSSFYPSVDLSLTHNEYFDNATFDRIDGSIDRQNIASVKVKWNIYNGGNNSSLNSIYKKKILQSLSLLEKTRLDIKLQYEIAKSDYEVSTDNLITNRLALKQAKENYNIVKNRFNVGISSSTDLTNANYLLTSVKQNYHRAYFDKFIAYATIKRVLEEK